MVTGRVVHAAPAWAGGCRRATCWGASILRRPRPATARQRIRTPNPLLQASHLADQASAHFDDRRGLAVARGLSPIS